MVEQPARAALEAVRQAAWEGQAGAQGAATGTELGPPSASQLAAAREQARVSREDPPGVQRWLRGLDDLTEAESASPTEGLTEGLTEALTGTCSGSERPQPAPPHLPGYRIEGELARGGMGVVYLAQDEGLERAVAIKVLRGAALAGHEDLLRFQLEAKATAALRHPGIVSVYATGIDSGGNPYLVMELVEGASLCEVLGDEGPLEPRRAASLIRQVALALDHAHRSGVLHRDLKPANVLVGPDGLARLTDFGIAKRVGVEEGLTETGQVLGTPSYMAPEQAEGQTSELGPRTDVYGLGATLFDLLTGRPPFVGVSTWQVLNAVVCSDPPAPSSLRPELDPALNAICLRCLEKEPQRRYPSASALAEDLERYLAGEAVRARPPSRRRRLERELRRHKVPLLVVASLLSLLLALALGLGQRRASVARGHLERAHRLARLGAPAGEVRQAVEAALEAEQSESACIEGAQALRAAGLEESADALLERAVAAHPPGIEALLALHQGHLRGGPSRFTDALARALEAARQSEALEGRQAALRDYALAEGLLETDSGRAVELLSACLERAPRFAWAYVARASAKESLGDLLGARQDLSRALEVDPRNFVALCNRGSILWAQGYLPAARIEFAAACTLDPQSDHARFLLGSLDLALEEHQEARRSLILAAGLGGPRAGDALALVAVCDQALGEHQLARGRAQRALEAGAQGEALARAHLVLAELAEDEGAALRHFEGALEAEPDSVRALVGRGELSQSLPDLDRALELAPGDARALRVRARLHVLAEDLNAARSDLERALALDPADAEAYLYRAEVSLLQGRVEEGLRDYGNAIRARPAWADPLLRRGVLLARLTRRKEAARDWRRALELLAPEDEQRQRVSRWLERMESE